MTQRIEGVSWSRGTVVCVEKQRRAGKSGSTECWGWQNSAPGELPATFRLGHQDDVCTHWHFSGITADTVNIVPDKAAGTDVGGVVTLGAAHHGSTLRTREGLPFNGTRSFPS